MDTAGAFEIRNLESQEKRKFEVHVSCTEALVRKQQKQAEFPSPTYASPSLVMMARDPNNPKLTLNWRHLIVAQPCEQEHG